MADARQDQSLPFTFKILPASAVSELRSIDGKIDPINLVEYMDDQNDVVTPLPLYIPQERLEAELDKEEEGKTSRSKSNSKRTKSKPNTSPRGE